MQAFNHSSEVRKPRFLNEFVTKAADIFFVDEDLLWFDNNLQISDSDNFKADYYVLRIEKNW